MARPQRPSEHAAGTPRPRSSKVRRAPSDRVLHVSALFRGYVTVQARGVIALPTELRRKLKLDSPGAQVHIVEREDGVVELVPQIAIPATQAYFWTDEWQAGEREVDQLVAEGEVQTFDDAQSFLAELSELAAPADGEA